MGEGKSGEKGKGQIRRRKRGREREEEGRREESGGEKIANSNPREVERKSPQ